MAIDYAALRNELLNDPQAYGYPTLVTNRQDSDLAAVLNFARDGTTPSPVNNVAGPAISLKRDDVSSAEIILCMDLADLPALPANPNNAALSTERRQLSYLEMLTNIPTVRLVNEDDSDTPVIGNLQSIFPASPSRTRLLALRFRDGSRAEQLFGKGTNVTTSDISLALN